MPGIAVLFQHKGLGIGLAGQVPAGLVPVPIAYIDRVSGLVGLEAVGVFARRVPHWQAARQSQGLGCIGLRQSGLTDPYG